MISGLKAWIIGICLTRGAAACVAQDRLPVFLCAGQSNMAGMRTDVAELSDPQLRLAQENFAFSQGEWHRLMPGSAQNPGAKWFGPEISFAVAMQQMLGHPVGIIKFSVGGSSLAVRWNPQNTDRNSFYYKLKELVAEARKQKDFEVVGVLWMQGEADSLQEESAEAYERNFSTLIQAFRADYGDPHLPFVAGRVNPPVEAYPFAGQIRTVIERFQGANYSWVDCDDLPKKDDHLHFTTRGYEELGGRMAKAMNQLIVKRHDNGGRE